MSVKDTLMFKFLPCNWILSCKFKNGKVAKLVTNENNFPVPRLFEVGLYEVQSVC